MDREEELLRAREAELCKKREERGSVPSKLSSNYLKLRRLDIRRGTIAGVECEDRRVAYAFH